MLARFRTFNLFMAIVIAMGVLFTATPPTHVQAISTTLVISQLQVAGETSQDEFIELHNVSNDAIDIIGYKLAYRSSSGIVDVNLVTWDEITVIPAGGYYLNWSNPWVQWGGHSGCYLC